MNSESVECQHCDVNLTKNKLIQTAIHCGSCTTKFCTQCIKYTTSCQHCSELFCESVELSENNLCDECSDIINDM